MSVIRKLTNIMRLPYKCLSKSGSVFVAASPTHVDTFNVETGSLLSSYSTAFFAAPKDQDSKSNGKTEEPNTQPVPSVDNDTSSPPAKKRRLSGDQVEEKKPKDESRAKSAALDPPNIIAMAFTSTGKHLVAVTAEDKTLRVFDHYGGGKLHQTSQRQMPKRPCAIAFTDDDSTIISADKFGDVYSLPLIHTPEPAGEAATPSAKSEEPEPKAFIPAANDKVVHSKRNLQALQNQLKMAKRVVEKKTESFEHKLLLGHVSMLTTLTTARENGRRYIITGDRDQHIRVSRGIPQTHITEAYCLSHKEFVSCLCIPGPYPDLLISGGGDDKIFLWNWKQGTPHQSLSIQKMVDEQRSSRSLAADEADKADETAATSAAPSKLAVSNICHARFHHESKCVDTIVVTCEGVPALFCFSLSSQSGYRMEASHTIPLERNPLSVIALDGPEDGIAVSLDFLHEAGSSSALDNNIKESMNKIAGIQVFGTKKQEPLNFQVPRPEDVTNSSDTSGDMDTKKLEGLSTYYYNLASLRKYGEED